MDYELEQFYKNKILKLEKEIRSLKAEYENNLKNKEHMLERISAQQNIIKKRNAIIKTYVDKYGKL